MIAANEAVVGRSTLRGSLSTGGASFHAFAAMPRSTPSPPNWMPWKRERDALQEWRDKMEAYSFGDDVVRVARIKELEKERDETLEKKS